MSGCIYRSSAKEPFGHWSRSGQSMRPDSRRFVTPRLGDLVMRWPSRNGPTRYGRDPCS